MKDEALSNDQIKIAELPIARNLLSSGRAVPLAESIMRLSSDVSTAHRLIAAWLHHEFDIENPGTTLAKATELDADTFVQTVRSILPRKRKLTAAEINELKREHSVTVEPARRARAEILVLEQQISGLVNDSYALTPEEVDLMWRTAPPRMPFTPAGLAEVDATGEADGDEE